MHFLIHPLTTSVRADAVIPSDWVFNPAQTPAKQLTAAPFSPLNTGSGFPDGMLSGILLLLISALAALTVILIVSSKKRAANNVPVPFDNAACDGRTNAHE